MSQELNDVWERTYASKPDDLLSWTQSVPQTSLDLIRKFGAPAGTVIDVGGGSSPLAAQLVATGTPRCTVLDISPTAMERARSRVRQDLGMKISWRVADVLTAENLPTFDIWHDRAVFHFLIEARERAAYAAQARRLVAPGGILIVGAFALNGPAACSGFPVRRYDADALAAEFAPGFVPRHACHEVHVTPWGAAQPFVYVVMDRPSGTQLTGS